MWTEECEESANTLLTLSMAIVVDDDLMIDDAPHCSTGEVPGPSTFYGWKFNHYFEVIQEWDKNIRVHCNASFVFATKLCLVHKT